MIGRMYSSNIKSNVQVSSERIQFPQPVRDISAAFLWKTVSV